MNTIKVNASKEYRVKIGSGLLSDLGSECAFIVKSRTAVIVSDQNVWPIYGKSAEESLKNAGFSVHHFIILPGENSKNGELYLKLLNFLAENRLTRSDCLIALGGGVVGDLTGFAAATYLRGIAYIQVPTTLLAMVDSSVGGKTAIDLPAGKNLAGAFYQPSLVLCDTDTLNTLPKNVFSDGCAEVIKYAVLFDKTLFSQLEEQGLRFHREEVISKCIQWKRDIVTQDEYDTGLRQLLNFGHTIGHAIEKESNYSISHGSAVAIGMCIIAKAATVHGWCEASTSDSIHRIVQQFGLPTSTSFTADVLSHHILSDKKRSGDEIRLIIPATIGCCQLKSVPVQALKSLIKAGM